MTVTAYRDRTTGRYPITLDDLRRSAGMLFGNEPTQAVLDFVGVDPVEAAAPPAYDPATQTLAEGEPASEGAAWRQTWTVENLPPVPEVFGEISDRQFFQAMALPPYSIITTQEALDAVKTGEIPQAMQVVIDGLPVADQFKTTMLVAGATRYVRTNPLVAVFGASRGMDEKAIDAFWRFAEAQ